MKPYYDDGQAVIYHADCLDLLTPELRTSVAVLVTDPPYGIEYKSGQYGTLPRSIRGDGDATLRDQVLTWWIGLPALVFGTWRVSRPPETKMLLVWDKGGALGMGDLSLPWKPGHEEVYVIGSGFRGHRTNDVLHYAPVQSMARNGRVHPLQKPIALMKALVTKCPDGVVFDPFMGSGSTLVAAKALGRKSIGVELEERYCDVAASRLSQQTLELSA